MQKATFVFESDNLPKIKSKVLNWIKQFSTFAYLDNNDYKQLYNRYELLAAAEPLARFDSINVLKSAFGSKWLFGHFNYDLKNKLHPYLESRFPASFSNQDLSFFEPGIVASIPFNENILVVESTLNPEVILEQILATKEMAAETLTEISFKRQFEKKTYLETVEQVKEHIRKGDCYELNLCVGAMAKHVQLNPIAVFQKLNQRNPSPFACLYRQNQHWLICSSPERFLMKDQQTLIAQPMKGTIKRDQNPEVDELQKYKLQQNPKERAENIMIADLMRNDLAMSCKTASVKAVELFGVYTYPTLHTMVSTITGELDKAFHPVDALLCAFPMGSMTGAPKLIVMQIIDQLERQRRELYSGSVGYFSPNGNFDFNVVIRSLLYNSNSQNLSYQTGGAITIDSDPESEWQEVLLKAQALENIFKA